MKFLKRIIRSFIFILIVSVVYLPFYFIPYDYIVLFWVFKIMLPSFIVGRIIFKPLLKIYKYFNLEFKGDFLLDEEKNLDESLC